MSLIADLEELRKSVSLMEGSARRQQFIYYKLISGMVQMAQEHRMKKDYAVSDAIRSLLNDVKNICNTNANAGICGVNM